MEEKLTEGEQAKHTRDEMRDNPEERA